MYIISRNREAIINTDMINVIFVGSDGVTIKADFGNGRGCQIERYDSAEECRTAMEIVMDNFGKSDICRMPDKDFIAARLKERETRRHHPTGKKAKGHGGT